MLDIAVLFDAGADVSMGPGFMPIHHAIAHGTMTLHGLAQDITGMAGFRTKYAGQTERGFVDAFYTEATGRSFPGAEADWWAVRIEAGHLARADFMVAVAASLPADAALRLLPEGAMFDAVW
jgi:hypothetical protein